MQKLENQGFFHLWLWDIIMLHFSVIFIIQVYNYKLVCIQDMTLVLTKNSIFLSLASFDQKLLQCAGGQSKKYYLYKLDDGCWHAGFDTLGRSGSIRCCSNAPCPESTSDWQYNDHGDLSYGDMAAQCLSGVHVIIQYSCILQSCSFTSSI